MDSLIDCKNKYRTVIEHFTLQIQMNQLQCNRCFIFITCELYSATCSLAGQPTRMVRSGLLSESQISTYSMVSILCPKGPGSRPLVQ